MRRQTTLAISCEKILKVKAQTMVFTQVQSDDEDDKKSVALSNYINNSTEEDFAQICHVTLIEDGEIEEEDAEDAPVELEEGVKATVDELREVNLGNTEDPQPIYTSASLTQEEEEAYIMLLHEFKYVFAWSYKEMPGLDPKVAVHHLSVKKGARPVKQGQRRFRPELIPLIETEVNKLIEVGFIREPFGLKNAGATYQRAMQRNFNDMLHKNVECYVDDLVVKSKKREDHLYGLRKVFERLRRYQLKMNPYKCTFGVTSGKFLGFIVRQRGIEIEQAKIDAILKMPEPRNIHELKSLQGKLAYLRRFISNLAGRCQPFSRLMKKEVPFEWDEACDKAFKSIKFGCTRSRTPFDSLCCCSRALRRNPACSEE
ncbi:UNVERIFIED_CONTAM: Retrovirus-related Pol polyprotein from transposon.6 [Sesamum latifolium]|uniref:Retrovirus-related Pol polyprotein from transposon.6 n=1 Tax=Sesamum latifolium TaxID=2727402 RepID=A0AAW2XUZ9_9LAMI